MKDTNVPVEKWEKEFERIFIGSDGKLVEIYVQYPENIKSFISQALQAAVEEERKRIAEEVEKSLEPSVGGDSVTVEMRILRNSGRKQALSIINKHQ